jgi:hypothetical protein
VIRAAWAALGAVWGVRAAKRREGGGRGNQLKYFAAVISLSLIKSGI